MAKKYFLGKKGNFLSDGKTKVKFFIDVFATEDEKEIALLKSCEDVSEINLSKAKKLFPIVFGEPAQEDEDNSDGENAEDDKKGDEEKDKEPETSDDQPGELTRKQLEEKAKSLGVSEEVLKKARSKKEVADMIKVAEGEV